MSILKQFSESEVAVERPAQAGSIAHRPTYETVAQQSRWGRTTSSYATKPRCRPDAQPCKQMSAGWAHHIGAVPCTNPKCFGSQP